MGQLRAFGAVVGPKSTPCAKQEAEGFEISQMDVDDAERGILHESVYVESAEFFGVHPGFAMDLHGEGLRRARSGNRRSNSERDHATEIACWFSRAQHVEPVAKPLEGQRVVCGEVHALFETEAVAHMYSGQVDDHNYFFHEHTHEAVLSTQGVLLKFLAERWFSGSATNGVPQGCPQRAHCSKLMADKLSMHRRRIGTISSWKLDTAKTSLSGRIGGGNPEGS